MGEDLCRAGTTKKLDRFSCASLYLRSIGKEGRGGEKKRDYRVHNGEGPSSLKLFWRRYACMRFFLSFLPSSVLLSLFPPLLTRWFEHSDLCMRNYTRGLRKNRNSMWWSSEKILLLRYKTFGVIVVFTFENFDSNSFEIK